MKYLELVTVCLFLLALGGSAAQGLDQNNRTIYVRQDCGSLSNCVTDFQSAAEMVLEWQPTAANPLLIDVGPGDFRNYASVLTCTVPNGQTPNPSAGVGYTTIRGAGETETMIGGQFFVGLWISACEGLTFQDLTIRANPEAQHAVLWTNGGSSTWTRATLSGATVGWYDSCNEFGRQWPFPAETALSVHYFFDSHIESRGDHSGMDVRVSEAYVALCAENWFFDSEIVAQADDPDMTGPVTGIDVDGTGDVRLFDSDVRVVLGANAPQGLEVNGVRLGFNDLNGHQESPGPQRLHHHGGTLEVDTSAVPGVRAVGVRAGFHSEPPPGAHPHPPIMVHTAGADFELAATPDAQLPDPGGITRLVQTFDLDDFVFPGVAAYPMMESPFSWPAGTEPPALTLPPGINLAVVGADLFLETDCQAAGSCTGGSEQHLMVYLPACGSSPWFDTETGRCRVP